MEQTFLNLSDDVICELLHYLDATSLYELGRTCIRLDELIRTHRSIWKYIDCRGNPNSLEKFTYCLDRCYNSKTTGTNSFLFKGAQQSDCLLNEEIFTKFNTFSRLSVLACENQTLNGIDYTVKLFPPQLIELSLKKTVVLNPLQFFRGSGDHFEDLKVLILDECDWLDSSAFMPISKYKNLEILSLYNCQSLDNSIAYLSIARQGFKNLKIFDARLSALGNTLISTFYQSQTLLALYFQRFHAFAGNLDLDDSGDDKLDDRGVAYYSSIRSNTNVIKFPKSVLYCDPYKTCSCNYLETPEDESPQISLTDQARKWSTRPRLDNTLEPPLKKRKLYFPSTSGENSTCYINCFIPATIESKHLLRNRHIRVVRVVEVPLKRLSLRGYVKITDESLLYLKHMDLDILDLTDTSVTKKAIENYLQSHPLCRILHQEFCKCFTNLN